MADHKPVNRYLRDNPELDDVDHALGRPADPFYSYRSHYVTGAHGDLAKRMDASPWWKRSVEMNNGNDVVFHVTNEGRRALADYLQAQANCERCTETAPQDVLNIHGNCETCAEDMGQ